MNLNEHYESIVLFNLAGGNKSPNWVGDDFWKMMWNQHLRQLEETSETTVAIEIKNEQELLDGLCDEFVVLMGKIYMAQQAGFDVNKALSLICENNLKKVTSNIAEAEGWFRELTDNTNLFESVVGDKTYYSIKRISDGKIMKHKNFPKVDISGCVPKE